ncbi:MAG: hypothetical protein E6K56_00310 [Ignavibacteria bacterium]|nr:MAG: hypothetical protein E6K56_00310 [Ignavibacteria bacterium]
MLTGIYSRALREAWVDGALSSDERDSLREWRASLRISEDEHVKLEQKAKLDVYTEAVQKAWAGGSISSGTADQLQQLREELEISTDQHTSIEQQVRKTVG